MSRCFPFPPPGYDKKISFDAEAWLKKEKEKKKRKKEKRDRKDKEKKDKKEKRDKKEKSDKKDKKRKHKKDKERSEDDQREKKDLTEVKDNDKHRETEVHNTSVENDKHREIERSQTSAEKDTVGPVKYENFKNIGLNCAQRKDTSEFKFLLGSGKTTRDEIKVKESPLVQKINLTGRRNPEESVTVLKDKRDTDRKVYGQGKEYVARSQNSFSLPSNIGGDERKVACVPGLADKRTTEQKENGMHKNVDGKKDGHKDQDREKKCKPKGEIGQDRANVKVPDAEQLQTKENKHNAVCFDNGKSSLLAKAENKTSNLGKRKALEMNDVLLHEKESQPNKLPRFRPPSNYVSEGGRNSEPCTSPSQPFFKFAEEVQNHNVSSKFSYNGFKLEETQATTQLVSEKLEKRDSHDVNNNIIPSHSIVHNGAGASNRCYASKQFAFRQLQTSIGHNMDDKVSLCHPVLRNGEFLDEAVTHLSSGGDVMIDDQKVNHNDLKINGLKDGKKTNESSPRPSSKKVKKNGGISGKPPHPDSKYLSQILTIPSVEWPDMDDQEWLFTGSGNRQSDKPTPGSSQVAEPKHVWSKALRIESADITALPYVIPY